MGNKTPKTATIEKKHLSRLKNYILIPSKDLRSWRKIKPEKSSDELVFKGGQREVVSPSE